MQNRLCRSWGGNEDNSQNYDFFTGWKVMPFSIEDHGGKNEISWCYPEFEVFTGQEDGNTS